MKYPLIVSNRDILGGKPCIKGSRISVQLILEILASGGNIDEIKNRYQHLPIEGIQQAILYANDSMKNEILIEIDHTHAA